jgi:hypothetical protein
VRDGTLGPGTAVQPAGPTYVITPGMGQQAGQNLFHSFETLSLRHDGPAGPESAHFQGAPGVENILARVDWLQDEEVEVPWPFQFQLQQVSS